MVLRSRSCDNADVRLVWTLGHHGWAFCSVTDDHTSAEAVASYVTDGPEQLLRAVEPTVYRWFFHRDGTMVTIRLVEAADSKAPEQAGTPIWRSRQPTTTLARAVIRAFDTVAHDLGEVGYQTQWGRPFPRHELEVLRSASRTPLSSGS